MIQMLPLPRAAQRGEHTAASAPHTRRLPHLAARRSFAQMQIHAGTCCMRAQGHAAHRQNLSTQACTARYLRGDAFPACTQAHFPHFQKHWTPGRSELYERTFEHKQAPHGLHPGSRFPGAGMHAHPGHSPPAWRMIMSSIFRAADYEKLASKAGTGYHPKQKPRKASNPKAP
jgi:hypothetical protein